MPFVMPRIDAPPNLPGRWREFLQEVDRQLPEPVQLHCLGGFALAACYGLPRPTGDLDYVSIEPREGVQTLEAIAGRGSKLAKKYGLYFQYVTIAEFPENYEGRLEEIFPDTFSNLHLLVLEVHDLVLAKLVRNYTVDRHDAKFLASAGVLNATLLRQRYEHELRPYLSNPEKHDLTLRLWLEACFPSHNLSSLQ